MRALAAIGAAIVAAISFLAVVIGMTIVLTIPIWWLWNHVMPEVFGLRPVDIWMALKMSMLSGLLFKSGKK